MAAMLPLILALALAGAPGSPGGHGDVPPTRSVEHLQVTLQAVDWPKALPPRGAEPFQFVTVTLAVRDPEARGAVRAVQARLVDVRDRVFDADPAFSTSEFAAGNAQLTFRVPVNAAIVELQVGSARFEIRHAGVLLDGPLMLD